MELINVSIRNVDKGLLDLLKIKYKTDNVSEVIKLALAEAAGRELPNAKPLFEYVGKKPPRIVKEVVNAFKQSNCGVFVDLFCGSLSMLPYLPENIKIVINDINGDLTNLYMVIREHPSDFIAQVQKLPYSENLFREFIKNRKEKKQFSKIEQAVQYYFLRFATYFGRDEFITFKSRKSKRFNFAKEFYENADFIMALSVRLQKVEILNRDFRKVLKTYDAADVFVYADCPYLYTEDKYENIFKEKDHVDLAEKLKKHQGKFALSSKTNKRLRKLYRSERNCILRFEAMGHLKSQRHREALIFNFPVVHFDKNGVADIKPYD